MNLEKTIEEFSEEKHMKFLKPVTAIAVFRTLQTVWFTSE